MLDKNLIRRAINKALIHKEKTKDIVHILDNKEEYVDKYYNKLVNEEHKFKLGYFKTINSSQKNRKIQVPTLNDHIVQHIIMQVLSPVIMKGMYKWNCGVIPRRGPIYAQNYLDKVIKRHNPKYVFKMDIKEFFHNVDTDILIKQLERRIKDKKFISFMKDMLETANQNTKKGIPIGFYSSQWLSNFYLQDLDHYIKQELGAKWYVRYMDDLVILGDNKRQLHRFKNKIFRYMRDVLKISPNRKYQVFPLRSRHIDFVGYLIGETEIKLRKRTFKIFKRRMNALKKNINIFLCRSYMSLRGWLVHCDIGRKFLKNHEPPDFYNKIKNYISKRDKENMNYEKLCKGY